MLHLSSNVRSSGELRRKEVRGEWQLSWQQWTDLMQELCFGPGRAGKAAIQQSLLLTLDTIQPITSLDVFSLANHKSAIAPWLRGSGSSFLMDALPSTSDGAASKCKDKGTLRQL